MPRRPDACQTPAKRSQTRPEETFQTPGLNLSETVGSGYGVYVVGVICRRAHRFYLGICRCFTEAAIVVL
eukprot:6934773-Prymnesium_polylepis.1